MQLGRLFKRLWAPRSAHHPPQDLVLDSAEFYNAPYDIYRQARRAGAILPCRPAGLALTRHTDIKMALSHPDLGNAPSRFSTLNRRNAEKYVAADLASNILPFLDKPDHVPVRKAVAAAFFACFRDFPAQLDGLAHDQAQEFAQAGGGDLLAGFAKPFTIQVMCRFLGLPAEAGERLQAYAESFFLLFAPIADPVAFERVNRDLAAFRALISGHMQNADSGVLAYFRNEGGRGLSDTQIVDACILLFADGVENVAAAIGTVMLTLAQEPGARAGLARGDVPLTTVIDEALRRDTPGQIITRIARRDTQVAGTAVSAETAIFLLLGSANHDESVFADPQRFDGHRDLEPMLTFGGGRHSCIGAQLARSQVAVAVGALVELGVEVTSRSGQVRYAARFGHRWPISLSARIAG